MRDALNYTLLHSAAFYNSPSCISVFLRFAPHLVDAVNVFNRTPLLWAVMCDKRDAMKMLLRAGADVRKKDKDGRTVLDWARMLNKKEMLEILEQHQQVSGIF